MNSEFKQLFINKRNYTISSLIWGLVFIAFCEILICAGLTSIFPKSYILWWVAGLAGHLVRAVQEFKEYTEAFTPSSRWIDMFENRANDIIWVAVSREAVLTRSEALRSCHFILYTQYSQQLTIKLDSNTNIDLFWKNIQTYIPHAHYLRKKSNLWDSHQYLYDSSSQTFRAELEINGEYVSVVSVSANTFHSPFYNA